MYWCIATIHEGSITPRPGTNYSVSYDQTTGVIDFGTYQGYPVCVYLIPKSKQTGAYLVNYYYRACYRDIKITLTSSPTIGSPLTGVENKELNKKISINPDGIKRELNEWNKVNF